jgi:hypothetical protein
MNVLCLRLAAFSLFTLALQLTVAAHAQEVPRGTGNSQALSELDPHRRPPHRSFESPERFILELRGGGYHIFSCKNAFFQDDWGPQLGAQLDGIVYREPDWFYVTLGGSLGWIKYSGQAKNVTNDTPVSEETTLSLIPLTATVGFRLDVLARQLRIPLILGARLGWEWAHWDTSTGARADAAGWSIGPVMSAQLALDLDSFERGGARALDEEWGINHTYIFGEVFKFIPTGNSLAIGTTSWLLGLGFVF